MLVLKNIWLPKKKHNNFSAHNSVLIMKWKHFKNMENNISTVKWSSDASEINSEAEFVAKQIYSIEEFFTTIK